MTGQIAGTAYPFAQRTSPTGAVQLAYMLDPPYTREVPDYEDAEVDFETVYYVLASALVLPFGMGEETMLFPADAHGNATDGGEIGMVAVLSHAAALGTIGYVPSTLAPPGALVAARAALVASTPQKAIDR